MGNSTSIGSARRFAADLALATRQGLASARSTFNERRRIEGESAGFREAFASARRIPGWLSRAESEALYELASSISPDLAIVEIGSYLGRSTAFLGLGASDSGSVYAVDPHTGDRSQVDAGFEGIDTSQQFLRNMQSVGVSSKVRPLIMTSLQAASEWEGGAIGFLFVDGWHSAEAVFEDGTAWAPHLARNAFVVFDDVNHPEVASGIERLVAAGTVEPIAGRVGKMGICGPPAAWPRRIRRIAQKPPTSRGLR